MALVRQFSKDGVDYPEAYSRITLIRCDKNDAYIFVCTYSNEESRFADEYPVYTEELMAPLVTLDSGVFFGAYEFAKTCPGFEGAEDHLTIEAIVETAN